MLLSDLLGAEVRAADGTVAGRLVDLAVEMSEARPVVRRLAVGRGQRTAGYVDWAAVVAFEHDGVQLGTAGAVTGGVGEAEVLLRRDVLDTQVVDVAGKRLARVSEVLLSRDGEQVEVVAVEVGAAGVWRRLGLRRLAHRTPTRSIRWADLHLTSTRGHALQLTTPGAAVHRLAGPELAAVVAHLPTDKGAQILAAVSPEQAAAALSAAHPRVSARLLHAVSRATASALVGRMPVDDATSALRSLPAADVELLLADVVSERAATLRRLLAHPADTAGGLMTPRS